MRFSIITFVALLSIASFAQAQLIDIHGFGIPNFVFRLVGFFGRWRDTENWDPTTNSGDFEGVDVFPQIDGIYALATDDKVYKYEDGPDPSNPDKTIKVWSELLAGPILKYAPTALSSIYAYVKKGVTDDLN